MLCFSHGVTASGPVNQNVTGSSKQSKNTSMQGYYPHMYRMCASVLYIAKVIDLSEHTFWKLGGYLVLYVNFLHHTLHDWWCCEYITSPRNVTRMNQLLQHSIGDHNWAERRLDTSTIGWEKCYLLHLRNNCIILHMYKVMWNEHLFLGQLFCHSQF